MSNNGITCYMPESDSVGQHKLDISSIRDNYQSFCEDKEGNILFMIISLGLVVLEKPFTAAQKVTLCNSGNYLPNRLYLYRLPRQQGSILAPIRPTGCCCLTR